MKIMGQWVHSTSGSTVRCFIKGLILLVQPLFNECGHLSDMSVLCIMETACKMFLNSGVMVGIISCFYCISLVLGVSEAKNHL